MLKMKVTCCSTTIVNGAARIQFVPLDEKGEPELTAYPITVEVDMAADAFLFENGAVYDLSIAAAKKATV